MAGGDREALTPSDLYWWYGDQPRARTTMALLMLLDRRPDPEHLRAAAQHASEVVPRLRQRVVEAPWGVALPRWEPDPTFDLSYHLRRYSLADVRPAGGQAELFRAIGPIYERPFDRSRPLWELIELDLPDDRAGLFFRLHHSIADGVGANAVLAAITDATREGDPRPPARREPPGVWPERDVGGRLVQALRDRVEDAQRRARGVTGLLRDVARDPRRDVDAGRAVGSLASDLLQGQAIRAGEGYGRARRLGGVAIPFAPLREARARLGCRTIELLVAGVAGAMGEWRRQEGRSDVNTLLTAVPVNLRSAQARGLDSRIGNEVNAMLMHLPIGERDPRRRLAIVRELIEAKRDHPAVGMLPASAAALSVLPPPLHRAISLAFGGMVDLIVTNVPGIPVTRFVAGAEIEAAYPIAPVMPHCPLSIALYGYRDHLYVGIDADGSAIPDVTPICELLEHSLAEIADA